MKPPLPPSSLPRCALQINLNARGCGFCDNHTCRIDIATARRLLEQNHAQQDMINSLVAENQQLQEMKRQKVRSCPSFNPPLRFPSLSIAPNLFRKLTSSSCSSSSHCPCLPRSLPGPSHPASLGRHQGIAKRGCRQRGHACQRRKRRQSGSQPPRTSHRAA